MRWSSMGCLSMGGLTGICLAGPIVQSDGVWTVNAISRARSTIGGSLGSKLDWLVNLLTADGTVLLAH